VKAPRRNDAELSQVAAQRIDEHRPLPNQEIADTVRDERRLLLRGLHRHEAHGGPTHGLADRFGIGGIVLVALHVRLHVAGRHQPHVMPDRGDLTCPKVRSAASLHPYNTGRKSSEEGCDLAAAQTPAQHHLPGRVNSVQLENVLRDVDADSGNLAHGWLPLLVIFDDHHFGTQMP